MTANGRLIRWQLRCTFAPTVDSLPLLQFVIDRITTALESSPVTFAVELVALRDDDATLDDT